MNTIPPCVEEWAFDMRTEAVCTVDCLSCVGPAEMREVGLVDFWERRCHGGCECCDTTFDKLFPYGSKPLSEVWIRLGKIESIVAIELYFDEARRDDLTS